MPSYRKYTRAFSLGMQSGLEYRADFFLGLVSAFFPIFIQFFMWSAIYGKSTTPVLFGYTFPQMITYTIMASLLNRLLRTGFEYEITDDIKNGGLSKFIIRPIHYFPYRMCAFLGQKTLQTGLVSVVLALVIAILSRTTGGVAGPAAIGMFVLSVLLAFVLNFVIFYGMGAVAFWLAEIGFFFEAVRIVFIALSGGIFPLDVLGPQVAAVLKLLPFQYTINFPVDVLNGRITGGDAWLGIGVQLVWIVLLSLVAGWVWKQGTKKFIAVGG